MDFANSTISDFLAALGSKEATPGGGGAAALTGANAAALVTMVARLTAGRPAFAEIEERVQHIIAQGDSIRAELTAANAKEAQIGATESPLTIARHCATLTEFAAELAESGNPQTVTDAATAVLLAEAALQVAILQARINLISIKDAD